MCWGQFGLPNPAASAAYGAPLNSLGATDNQQGSGSPDGSDYLDETLLGHITDDALLGFNMDGELDILDALFKEEPAAAELGTVKECSAENADFVRQQSAASYVAKPADTASDHSAQTPSNEQDLQGVSSSENEVTHMDALRAQLLGGQPLTGAQQQAAVQQMAAQQMAAAAAAAQLQINPQLGMLPNIAAMQMLAANQGMLNFPFASQVLMQPNFGFNIGVAASKPGLDNEEAVERIKKKRRESAQRSRARKNQYMKALEVENMSLRSENSQLRECLLSFERQFGLKMPEIQQTQMAVRPLPDSFMHDMCE